MKVTGKERAIKDKEWMWIQSTAPISLNSYSLFRILKDECNILFNVMYNANRHDRKRVKKMGAWHQKSHTVSLKQRNCIFPYTITEKWEY